MPASYYELDSAVWRFYEYQSIWAPVIGDKLPCKPKMHNPHNSFAMVVTKDHVIIGHLPRKFLATF